MPRTKKCPNPSCTFKYTNIVTKCLQCLAFISSSDKALPVSKPKVKPKVKKKVKHPTVYLRDGVFSVQYWQHNRCFVRVSSELCDTGEDTNYCTKASCSDNRGLCIRNNQQFYCPHIQKVKDDLQSGVVNTK